MESAYLKSLEAPTEAFRRSVEQHESAYTSQTEQDRNEVHLPEDAITRVSRSAPACMVVLGMRKSAGDSWGRAAGIDSAPVDVYRGFPYVFKARVIHVHSSAIQETA